MKIYIYINERQSKSVVFFNISFIWERYQIQNNSYKSLRSFTIYTNIFHFSSICLILTTILSATKQTPNINNYESTKYKEEKEVEKEISTSIKETFLLVQQQ